LSAAFVATRHDVSPEAALGAIRSHGGPILLDLDETLYLRNSTEDFIDSVRPRLAALLLMRALDVFKPWRWTGGDATRDVWRVRAVATCFPWTARRWRREVTGLAARFTNLRLLAALDQPLNPPIITTAGFEQIVAPLVAALGLPHATIVAARLSHFADRRDGKLQRVRAALGDATLRESLVLTDSAEDLTLLEACARPLRAIWPEARYQAALRSVYLPGQYLSVVKRPGARYIVRAILQEDFTLWILCSIALATQPLLHVAGLTLLLVSFWAIYERGYVDNDLMGARFEAKPRLNPAFWEAPVATPRWSPWIWALGCGAAALFLLRWPLPPRLPDFAAWACVLLATHAWFALYNRLDKDARVWMFMGLQITRSAAFVAVLPIALIGAVAICAHVLARWVPYYLYRLEGKEWPEAPFHLIRLLFFVVLAGLLALAVGIAPLASGTTAALLAWNVYRARHELATAWRATHRIDAGPPRASRRPPGEAPP
jgi:phosphoserine phosphatase